MLPPRSSPTENPLLRRGRERLPTSPGSRGPCERLRRTVSSLGCRQGLGEEREQFQPWAWGPTHLSSKLLLYNCPAVVPSRFLPLPGRHRAPGARQDRGLFQGPGPQSSRGCNHSHRAGLLQPPGVRQGWAVATGPCACAQELTLWASRAEMCHPHSGRSLPPLASQSGRPPAWGGGCWAD